MFCSDLRLRHSAGWQIRLVKSEQNATKMQETLQNTIWKLPAEFQFVDQYVQLMNVTVVPVQFVSRPEPDIHRLQLVWNSK